MTHRHHEKHIHLHLDELVAERRSRRRTRGRGHPGRGRMRARRGAVAEGVLLILAERAPLHGYELIAELEARSEGRWRPSPGSMYPALSRMEDKGIIQGTETDDGKRVYELTDEGRSVLERRDPDAPSPWDADQSGGGGGLRSLVHEVASQARQVGRFGTPEQRERAVEVLERTRTELYGILADRSDDPAEGSDGPAEDSDGPAEGSDDTADGSDDTA